MDPENTFTEVSPDEDATALFAAHLDPEAHKAPTEAASAPKAETPDEAREDENEGFSAPEKAAETEADPDDAEFEFKEGEASHKAKLRELKAAFSKRADAEAQAARAVELRTGADADRTRATTALGEMLKRAEARYAPYAQQDFLLLSRTLDPATYTQIRDDAIEALKDVQYLKGELDGHVASENQRQTQMRQSLAQRCNEELKDPVKGIPDWGPKVFNEMADYAASVGVPRNELNSVVQPWAFKVLHKAMQFDKAAKSAAEKVDRVVQQPSRVLKPAGAKDNATGTTHRAALQALRDNGDDDDVIAAAFASTFRK